MGAGLSASDQWKMPKTIILPLGSQQQTAPIGICWLFLYTSWYQLKEKKKKKLYPISADTQAWAGFIAAPFCFSHCRKIMLLQENLHVWVVMVRRHVFPCLPSFMAQHTSWLLSPLNFTQAANYQKELLGLFPSLWLILDVDLRFPELLSPINSQESKRENRSAGSFTQNVLWVPASSPVRKELRI